MPETIQGPSYVEQQEGYTFDGRIERRTLNYIGLRSEIPNIIASFGLTGYAKTISPGSGPIATLEVDLGALADAQTPDIPLSIEWKLDSTTMEQTLWEHPKIKPILDAGLHNTDPHVSSEFEVGVQETHKWIKDSLAGKNPLKPAFFTAFPDIYTMSKKIISGTDSFLTPRVALSVDIKRSPLSLFRPSQILVAKVMTKQEIVDGTDFYCPDEIKNAMEDGDYMTMAAMHQNSSDGNRLTSYQWSYAKIWDTWIYPRTPPKPPGP